MPVAFLLNVACAVHLTCAVFSPLCCYFRETFSFCFLSCDTCVAGQCFSKHIRVRMAASDAGFVHVASAADVVAAADAVPPPTGALHRLRLLSARLGSNVSQSVAASLLTSRVATTALVNTEAIHCAEVMTFATAECTANTLAVVRVPLMNEERVQQFCGFLHEYSAAHPGCLSSVEGMGAGGAAAFALKANAVATVVAAAVQEAVAVGYFVRENRKAKPALEGMPVDCNAPATGADAAAVKADDVDEEGGTELTEGADPRVAEDGTLLTSAGMPVCSNDAARAAVRRLEDLKHESVQIAVAGAGSLAGGAVGAAAGTLVFPGAGSVLGSLVGTFVGGYFAPAMVPRPDEPDDVAPSADAAAAGAAASTTDESAPTQPPSTTSSTDGEWIVVTNVRPAPPPAEALSSAAFVPAGSPVATAPEAAPSELVLCFEYVPEGAADADAGADAAPPA